MTFGVGRERRKETGGVGEVPRHLPTTEMVLLRKLKGAAAEGKWENPETRLLFLADRLFTRSHMILFVREGNNA